MKRRATVRATRLTHPTNQVDRGAEVAARRVIAYWCAADHHTGPTFAADVEAPEEWPCRRCGAPASTTRGSAPAATRPGVFFRTPYEFLLMRRSVEDGERILSEALDKMREERSVRGAGSHGR